MSEETSLLADFQQADSSSPIEKVESQVSSTQTSTTPPEPSAPPAALAGEKQPVSLQDDDPVEFTVAGQKIRKAWKEILQTQALLPADYTRKTQRLAEDRRVWEQTRQQSEQTWTQKEQAFQQAQSQFEQQRQALTLALQDPRKIEALYLAAVARQGGQTSSPAGQGLPVPQQSAPPAQTFDPKQLLSHVDQLVNQRFEAVQRAAQADAITTQRAGTIEKHVDSILTANPVLKALPNINNYLYNEVMSMVEPGRTTLEEAQHLLDTVAQSVAQSLNTHYTESRKTSAVAAGQLRNGIEPPGGAPQLPTPKKYNRKFGLEDPEMEKDVMAFLKANLGGGA